jgi:putative FmdB family regulatory protein
MPIYEFSCNGCNNRVSVFVRSMSSEVSGKCDRCGSQDLRRLISRVAFIKSGGDFDSLDDDKLMSGFDESDPRAMAAWARKMQRETGEEMGPEFEEMVEKLERGESLDDEGFGGDDDFDDDGGFDDL